MSSDPQGIEHLLPTDRRFGLFWAAVFAVAAAAWAWMGGAVAAGACLAASVAFAALALVRPGALRGLNAAWLRLGLLLSRVVNPVVMGLLYFGLLTPVGLLQRAFGRDELRLRRPTPGGSLWVERRADPRGARSFKDQY